MNEVDITLGDLDPDHVVEIVREHKVVLRATASELIREGRLPRFLTLDEIEFAFSGPIASGPTRMRDT